MEIPGLPKRYDIYNRRSRVVVTSWERWGGAE